MADKGKPGANCVAIAQEIRKRKSMPIFTTNMEKQIMGVLRHYDDLDYHKLERPIYDHNYFNPVIGWAMVKLK